MADIIRGSRRRKWSQAARDARTYAIQTATNHHTLLTSLLTDTQQLEHTVREHPQQVPAFAQRLGRDLALIQAGLADIRTRMIDPRPDPLNEDQRRLGWPPDLRSQCSQIAETAHQHELLASGILRSLIQITEARHTNQSLLVEQAIAIQRDIALISAAVANIRSDLLTLTLHAVPESGALERQQRHREIPPDLWEGSR